MGGKKKASKPPIKKESKYKIPAMYGCPLCDAKASIVIKIVRKAGEASVRCRMCGATKNGVPCNRLEKNCDVYFRFRDSVQLKDRQFLREHGIQAEAGRQGMEGLQVLEEKERYHLNHLVHNHDVKRLPNDRDDDELGHQFAAEAFQEDDERSYA